MKPLPALFFGHGNPMNALGKNPYSTAWASIGRQLPHPRAILSISAHWYIPAAAVMANRAPTTLHDFGGFPPELYQVEYPAPGSPELAKRLQGLLFPLKIRWDEEWGLDHGTWSVLRHVFPQADVPVVQLSIDETQPPEFHYNLGKKLAPLREEGVLIVSSGNIVHNLGAYAWGRPDVEPFDWAVRFEQRVQELLTNEEDVSLINYKTGGREAALSVPTPDHYLPLLYVLATRQKGDGVSFPVKGIDGGSVSMLAVRFG